MEKSQNDNQLTFTYGHPMGNGGYLITGLLILVSLLFFAKGNEITMIFAIATLALGVIVGTMSSELIIDLETKTYCSHESFKKQQWKDLTPFTDICILSKRYSQTSSVRGAIPTSQTEIQNQIYLMDQYHVKRIYLETVPENEKIESRLTELANQLKVEIKTYNPITKRNRK